MKDILSILLLWPFAAVYGIVVWLRAELYRLGWLKSHSAGVPVISVGNITVGGTGKTPMAIHIAQILMNNGVRVAVLSRGYKRKSQGRKRKTKTFVVSDGAQLKCGVEEAGDEPFLIATRLLGSAGQIGAVVIVGKDRVAGAKKAVELGAQAIVLDDGFQHLRLKRDLDIVLLDYKQPLGNGWILPAGKLREPHNALRRASALVLTRSIGTVDLSCVLGLVVPGKPIFSTRHVNVCLVRWPANEPADVAPLKDKQILLFSGIARPESFEQSVDELGFICTRCLRFGDHHRYSKNDLRKISSAAIACDALITTEKDAVRLPLGWNPGKPLYVLRVGIEFVKDAENFEQMILHIMKIPPQSLPEVEGQGVRSERAP